MEGDEQPVVTNLCQLGLEDTKQVGRVDKDDNYRMIILVTKTYIQGWMENLPHKRLQVSIFSLVRNAIPAFSWEKKIIIIFF